MNNDIGISVDKNIILLRISLLGDPCAYYYYYYYRASTFSFFTTNTTTPSIAHPPTDLQPYYRANQLAYYLTNILI